MFTVSPSNARFVVSDLVTDSGKRLRYAALTYSPRAAGRAQATYLSGRARRDWSRSESVVRVWRLPLLQHNPRIQLTGNDQQQITAACLQVKRFVKMITLDRATCAHSRGAACGILTRVLATYVIALPLVADSSPWSVSNLQDTGLSGALAVMTSAGELIVVNQISGPGACAQPTASYGSTNSLSSCVTKVSGSGQTVFSVEMNATGVIALVVDAAGDVVIAGGGGGSAGMFPVTAGAYETVPGGLGSPALCKLSGADGHPLYCTFTDVSFEYNSGAQQALVVDAAGNAYIAGTGAMADSVIEKINAGGTAADYLTTVGQFNLPCKIAVDASGNLYCLTMDILNSNALLAEVNGAGGVIGSIGLGDETPLGIVVDASGNPEVVLADSVIGGNLRVRKYGAGLGGILFDTSFFAGGVAEVLAVGLDSSGIIDVVGMTTGVNLTDVNPTQSCPILPPPAPGYTGSQNAWLVRVDGSGNLVESSYLQAPVIDPDAIGVSIAPAGEGALVALTGYLPSADVVTLTLGAASVTVALGCVGNAASFLDMALAPNEIVAAFGSGIGPATPVTAAPDANGLYPSSAGGFEITFDGVAVPILYASSGQVNLITPGALAGKSMTEVCAVINGATANCITALVTAAAPGFFPSASGSPVVVNQDETVNSEQNPAAEGSVISLYGTGFGATTPVIPDGGIAGLPLTALNTTFGVGYTYRNLNITVGPPQYVEYPAQVFYLGPAPLEVEGLTQINVAAPSLISGEQESSVPLGLTTTSTQGVLFSMGSGAQVWVK